MRSEKSVTNGFQPAFAHGFHPATSAFCSCCSHAKTKPSRLGKRDDAVVESVPQMTASSPYGRLSAASAKCARTSSTRIWFEDGNGSAAIPQLPRFGACVRTSKMRKAELLVPAERLTDALKCSPYSVHARVFGKTLLDMRYVASGGVEGQAVSFAPLRQPTVFFITAACAAKHRKTYRELQRVAGDKGTPLTEVHRIQDLVSAQRPGYRLRLVCCTDEVAGRQEEWKRLTGKTSTGEQGGIVVSMSIFLESLGKRVVER